MVLKVNVTISPADLTDLYVINDNLPIREVKRLSNFEVSGNVLIGSIQASQTTDTIRIISSGYVEQILTFSEIQTNPDIVLVSANEAENLSNGTNTYPLADKTARNIIDSLDDVAFNGVRVDQTYDAISTNAQSGTAVAEAISDMLDALYPVGSRYITENATCPLSTLIPGSTWVLTSQGRVIQGADSNHAVGTTANAGLPNIKSERSPSILSLASTLDEHTNGPFQFSNPGNWTRGTSSPTTNRYFYMNFDASRSSSIYGKSTTVQPPAEFVNIFKRTA